MDASGFPSRADDPKCEQDRKIKVPQWLNDPTAYHNEAKYKAAARARLYGDVAGLDDLFTEQPQVVQGMIDIYDGLDCELCHFWFSPRYR